MICATCKQEIEINDIPSRCSGCKDVFCGFCSVNDIAPEGICFYCINKQPDDSDFIGHTGRVSEDD